MAYDKTFVKMKTAGKENAGKGAGSKAGKDRDKDGKGGDKEGKGRDKEGKDGKDSKAGKDNQEGDEELGDSDEVIQATPLK